MTDKSQTTDSNFVCGRFLMFRDGTAEAKIVETGTREQCDSIAADPPVDIDSSGDGWDWA